MIIINIKNLFMIKKILLNISLCIFIFFSLILSTKVFAETTETNSAPTDNNRVSAYTNIQNLKIISQEKNRFIISFDIYNGKGVQTGVKYGVNLTKEAEVGGQLVDEKIYDEILSLAENTTITKKIIYNAPESLEGNFELYIRAKNENGFRYGVALVDKVELVAINKGIIILPETCSLSIVGEKILSGYSLLQGVDIDQNESLSLSCTAVNTSDQEIEATPVYETHYRTTFGKIVPQTEGDKNVINFGPNEKKSINLTLPKALSPQAYDVKINLEHKGKKSNDVVVHYVLQGISATIQNLSLDKDYYGKDDTAKIYFSWTPSADSFPESRQSRDKVEPDIYLSVDMLNKKGENCALQIKQLLSKEYTKGTEVLLPIIEDCINPKLIVSLTDQEGKILDERTLSFKTATKDNPYRLYFIIGFIILILLILILVIYKNKKNHLLKSSVNIASILLIVSSFVFLGSLFPQKEIKAIIVPTSVEYEDNIDYGAVSSTGGSGTLDPSEVITISFTPTKGESYIYKTGENIPITMETYYEACDNVAQNILITGFIDGFKNESPKSYTGETKNMFSSIVAGTTRPPAQNSSFTAPDTIGSYTLNMELKSYTVNNIFKSEATELFNGPEYTSFLHTISEKLANYSIDKEDDPNGWDILEGSIYVTLKNQFPNATYMASLQNYLEENYAGAVTLWNLSVSTLTSTTVKYTRTFAFDFEVTGPTVNVTITNKDGVYVDGPVLKSVGQDVYIRWEVDGNPESCVCTCRDPNNPDDSTNEIPCGNNEGANSSCGSGISAEGIYQRINNVARDIKFDVNCE